MRPTEIWDLDDAVVVMTGANVQHNVPMFVGLARDFKKKPNFTWNEWMAVILPSGYVVSFVGRGEIVTQHFNLGQAVADAMRRIIP